MANKKVLWISGLLLVVILISSCTLVKNSTKKSQPEVDVVVDAKTPAIQKTENNGQQQTTPPEQPQAMPTPSAGSGVTQCNIPSGFFSVVYVRQKNAISKSFPSVTDLKAASNKLDVAGIFKYTGNCPTDIYLEAGIVNAPTSGLFSLLPSEFKTSATGSPSNCDGNVHYNGAVYHVEPNQDIKFRFQPENYGAESTYPINIGAYWGGSRTGCLSQGGATLTELHSKVSFSDTYSDYQISHSYIYPIVT